MSDKLKKRREDLRSTNLGNTKQCTARDVAIWRLKQNGELHVITKAEDAKLTDDIIDERSEITRKIMRALGVNCTVDEFLTDASSMGDRIDELETIIQDDPAFMKIVREYHKNLTVSQDYLNEQVRLLKDNESLHVIFKKFLSPNSSTLRAEMVFNAINIHYRPETVLSGLQSFVITDKFYSSIANKIDEIVLRTLDRAFRGISHDSGEFDGIKTLSSLVTLRKLAHNCTLGERDKVNDYIQSKVLWILDSMAESYNLSGLIDALDRLYCNTEGDDIGEIIKKYCKEIDINSMFENAKSSLDPYKAIIEFWSIRQVLLSSSEIFGIDHEEAMEIAKEQTKQVYKSVRNVPTIGDNDAEKEGSFLHALSVLSNFDTDYSNYIAVAIEEANSEMLFL